MRAPVLVTGGAGYIGSHVVLSLLDGGWAPVVLDDLSTGMRDAIPEGVPFVHAKAGDEGVAAGLIGRFGIEDVIHLAGSIDVQESLLRPDKYYENNLAQTILLANACAHAGVKRFIFSSTCAVYGNSAGEPVTEKSAVEPLTPYAKSKYLAESILRDLESSSGMRTVSLRYFNVAGADARGRSGQRAADSPQLIARVAAFALGRRAAIEVFGTDCKTRDGSCARDYIHVSDLADAHLAVLKYMRGGGGIQIFNCGYGRPVTVLEIISSMEKISGRTLPYIPRGRRAGDAESVVACADLLGEATGWKARHDDLETIVGSAWAWHQRMDAMRQFEG